MFKVQPPASPIYRDVLVRDSEHARVYTLSPPLGVKVWQQTCAVPDTPLKDGCAVKRTRLRHLQASPPHPLRQTEQFGLMESLHAHFSAGWRDISWEFQSSLDLNVK